MNRMAILIIAAVVLLFAAGGVGWYFSGAPVEVAVVQSGEIQEFVDERGRTRLPQTYLITMPDAGRVQAIDLPPGSVVQENQIVARIVPEDLRLAVDETQSVVARLEASIEENSDMSLEKNVFEQAKRFVESMDKTVAAADARKVSGQKRMEFAETFLGRVRALYRDNARTQEDVDRAEVDLVESTVNFQQDVLVWEAMKSIASATHLLPTMVEDYILRKGMATKVLERQKQEAQARLSRMQLSSQRGQMRSPVAGIVLDRHVENEQFLAAGTTLLTIGQLDRMQVEADVLSEDVVRVQPGDPVRIYGPAVGRGVDQGLSGTVDQVYPAGFTKLSSLGVEQQRVKVIVRLDADVINVFQQGQVGVGYRVRVRIFTDEKDDALVVPRSALFRGPHAAWQVYLLSGSRLTLREVKVGLMNDDRAQILEGLEEGDRIVLAPESHLTAGARVKPM